MASTEALKNETKQRITIDLGKVYGNISIKVDTIDLIIQGLNL